jgi:hypothetical protein
MSPDSQALSDFVISHPKAKWGAGLSLQGVAVLGAVMTALFTVVGIDRLLPNVRWDFSSSPNPRGDLLLLGWGLLLSFLISMIGLWYLNDRAPIGS